MATIKILGPLRHLRAEPNQFILHYRRGKLARKGPGLAYWFNSYSAALAQLPVEDCETTFMLKERTVDFQQVSIQVTLTYRIEDPVKAAKRVNFAISPETGVWLEEPLQRLEGLWNTRTQEPCRSFVAERNLTQVLVAGTDAISTIISDRLTSDDEIGAMGLLVVDVKINRIAPTSEMEKALQTPTRESLHQKADEAVFARRAMAVEKERQIKENELQTEIELATQQEHLIRKQGENTLLDVRQTAHAEKERIESENERSLLLARADADANRLRAEGEADAKRKLSEASAKGEALRVDVWDKASNKVLLGLALQEFAGKIGHIQHLNLSPNMLGDAFTQFLSNEASK